MKKIIQISILLIAIFLLVNGCMVKRTTIFYEPVYLPFETLYKSFKIEPPKELKNPGKIYIKDHFIFVNEIKLGIHIIDNSNPRSPENIGFIKVLGNHDLAIKGNILYADSYNDLITVDISQINNSVSKIRLVERVKFVFPFSAFKRGGLLPYPHGRISSSYEKVDPKKGVVIDWVETKRETHLQYTPIRFGGVLKSQSGGGAPSTGTGGSMSRFAISGNKLYTVDNNDMHVFNIEKSAFPVHLTKFRVGWFIETLFLYKKYLFIGSETGCYIYDTEGKQDSSSLISETSPRIVSQLPHARSEDPVVVRGRYAYVTLRNNQLHVIDISLIKYPTLVRNYSISKPFGLAVDSNYLYVCNQNDGLIIYDNSEPRKLKKLSSLRRDNPKIYDQISNAYINYKKRGLYDVILDKERIIAVGNGGLFQLKFDNNQLKLISTIKSQKQEYNFSEHPYQEW